MRQHSAPSRRGTALIIAMALIVFVVVTSTYYITTMGNYRGAGVKGSLELLADQAVQSGKAHAIRVLQRHALTPVDPSSQASLDDPDTYTSMASPWRTEFQADPSLEDPAILDSDGLVAVGEDPQENVPQLDAVLAFHRKQSKTPYPYAIADSLLAPFNTRWSGQNNALGESEHRAFCERIIDFLEIQHVRKATAGTLPYGLRKRVELARAVALKPDLILLDEPMAGMNLEEKEDMARYIIDLNEEWGMTVVMIEHDMGVVMDISHRVMVLDFGKKIAEGVPSEVLANEHVRRAYLGEVDDVLVDQDDPARVA